MGQLTIYIDKDTEEKMNRMVKSSGVSKSKWIADIIREKTSDSWPDSVVQLAGAWQDLPEAEDIRKGLGHDVKRERI
jgi:hypothetical protein